MDERLLRAEAIVFDVGNVLLSFEPEKVVQLIPEAHRAALYGAMFGPDGRWPAFDLGKESNEDIAASIARAAGVAGGRDMVLHALYRFPQTMRPLPLYRLIGELKALGKRLYALTNYAEPSFTFTKETYPALQLMDGEAVSSREKLVKPDPAFFRLLLQRYRLDPARTLFIDDVRANTDAAAALGLQVWHYAGGDRLPEG